ncbi:hypothetical protein GH714_038499 [Hevea brasiliensis]|uniref:Uncharacterized protein n=1 Tax=Hevea brasiliensis TaxID=3981 RepID=A0A6A6KGX7_HEVBR|nr:hypothetical protein GH714_038499 [Hevea brasiliensis]
MKNTNLEIQKQEKVSAETMRELMDAILGKRLFPLSVIRFDIDKDKHRVEKTTVEAGAKIAFDGIFTKLAGSNNKDGYMGFKTLLKLVGDEKVIQHFEGQEDQAYEMLEQIAKNTHLWSSPRGLAPTQKRQAAGMYDLDPFNMINAKFYTLTNVLAKKMEDLSMLVSLSSSSGSSQQVAYAEGTTTVE